MGYSILRELEIEFLPQHTINNKFCVDAFVPEWNLVIQFDGDYWHCHPNKYSKPSKLQKKNINRDKSHDAYMAKCKIDVYRIWESDLKNGFKFKNDMKSMQNNTYMHDKKS
jgi:G:T-mismatch repair DNA endonuclease (very short patch repair protein)